MSEYLRLEREQSAPQGVSDAELSCQQEFESARRSAEGLQSCQAELNTCEEKLSKTFLAVIIQWATERHDVDLHVIDPAGEEFNYERNT